MFQDGIQSDYDFNLTSYPLIIEMGLEGTTSLFLLTCQFQLAVVVTCYQVSSVLVFFWKNREPLTYSDITKLVVHKLSNELKQVLQKIVSSGEFQDKVICPLELVKNYFMKTNGRHYFIYIQFGMHNRQSDKGNTAGGDLIGQCVCKCSVHQNCIVSLRLYFTFRFLLSENIY